MSQIFLKIFTIFLTIIILLNQLNTKPCPIGEIVSSAQECTSNNRPGHHCCYLSSKSQNLSMCLQLSNNVYNGLKKFNIGGILYDIECENKEEKKQEEIIIPGSPCGFTNPTYADECKAFSTEKSSCCFFRGGSFTGCYNLGSPTKGSLTFLGMNLDC
jgi:hypothetical protein